MPTYTNRLGIFLWVAKKLKVCRVLRGKLLVPRTKLLKLLATE
jgi:hypothetical protein